MSRYDESKSHENSFKNLNENDRSKGDYTAWQYRQDSYYRPSCKLPRNCQDIERGLVTYFVI